MDNLIFSVDVNFCAILPGLGFQITKKGIRFITVEININANNDKMKKSMPFVHDMKDVKENKKEVTVVILKK